MIDTEGYELAPGELVFAFELFEEVGGGVGVLGVEFLERV